MRLELEHLREVRNAKASPAPSEPAHETRAESPTVAAAATAITPPALPEETLTPEARAVLEYFRAEPLSARGDRILRIISSTYYAHECCYAKQETLARAVRCAKSTLQLELDDLEARKLIHVTPRKGTSNVTVLADGVREALRFQRIENRRRALARRGVAPLASKSTTASSPMPPKRPPAAAAVSGTSVDSSSGFQGHFEPKKRKKNGVKTTPKNGSDLVVFSANRPKTTTWSEQVTSRTSLVISDKSYTDVKTEIISCVREDEQASETSEIKSEKIHVEKDENHVKSRENVEKRVIHNAAKQQEKPVVISLEVEHTTPQNGKEKWGEPAVVSRKVERTTPQNGKEGEKKAVTPSFLSHRLLPKAAALLVAEEVTPKRAMDFAQVFECEQIERNIALGLHHGKKNPPGYLLTLVRDDPAGRRIVPGSEADQVRQRERSGTLRGRNGPVKALEARESVPGANSLAQPKRRVSKAICGRFTGVSEPPGKVEDPLETLSPEDRAQYTQRAREDVLRANPWLGSSPRESNPIMQAMIRTQLRAMLATPEAQASRGAPSG